MTLRKKTGLLFALLVVLAVGVNGWLLLRQAEEALRRSIHAGVEAVASTAANQLAGNLERSRAAVARLAAHLPAPSVVGDRPLLDELLSGFRREAPEFADGFLLLDARGRLLASSPPLPRAEEASFAEEEFFRRSLEPEAESVVVPRRSRRSGEPVLTFCAPWRDRQGAFSGLLAASMPLRSDLAFSGLRRQSFGESGYLYAFDSTRRLILHPEDGRLLKRDVPPGANTLFDEALEGFEGVGETVNSRGIPMLLALRKVPGTDWILGAQQPVAEALAPLRQAQRSQLLVLLAGGIGAALAGWWLSGRLTRPLTTLRLAAEKLDSPREGKDAGTGLSPRVCRRRDEIGALARSFAHLHDSLQSSRNRLRHSDLEWQRTFDGVQDGILILDREHRIQRLNQAASELLGLPEQAAVGTLACPWLHGPGEPDSPCPFGDALTTVGTVEVGSLGRRKGHFEISSTPIHDRRGHPKGVLHLLRDLTAQTRAEERLLRLVHFDELTGLPNRQLMLQHVEEKLAAAVGGGEELAVLHVDLDRFKLINDSVGYEQGDRMIQVISERLAGLLKEGELLGRVGSDEWLLIFTGPSLLTGVVRRIEELLQIVSEPVDLEGNRRMRCNASVGVALFPKHGRQAEVLVRNAEIALLQAKDAGRKGFRLYSPRLSEKALQRSLLAVNLRHALEREELALHYQPKIDLQTGRAVGMEALLRWNSAEFGPVPPGQFVPMAEELGLIEVLGEWVLRMACAQTRILQLEGFAGLQVSVNLSPLQLRQPGLVERIARILEETGLPASSLELELTETMLMANLRNAARKLRELHQMGVQVSIDDFGTGYSALNYLKRLPVTRLKIDRAFVQDITRDPNDASIVDIILTIGRSMNLRVIGEGVETVEQLRFLMEGDCHEAQGHLFSPAVPPAELRRALSRTYPLPLPSVAAANQD